MTELLPIATRILTWRDGERELPVEIRLFAPDREGEGSWACRFEIDWPTGMRSMTAHGYDAVQALVHALNMIGVQLYTSEYHGSGNLFSDKPGSGYGFPVGSNVRDLLVGDDKKYF